ncbi:MAG TPA: tRNA (N6-threonylcarbamoyladenosine(37)-N6)-methyltransferase TrmO [Chryseosolibacter sp.]
MRRSISVVDSYQSLIRIDGSWESHVMPTTACEKHNVHEILRMTYTINPIGIVHSELKRIEDCPRQENEGAPEATLELFAEYIGAASDIRAGDTLILITWLDRANRGTLATYPRNDTRLPLTGIFSTRSPDRPNPIGLHEVTVIAVEAGNKIKVSFLEVLDGTPIIDIKSTR